MINVVRRGMARPGPIQRQLAGFTARVFNKGLRRLIRYGTVARDVLAAVPPHVEYRLTAFGKRFGGVLERIEALDRDLRRGSR